MRNRIKSFCVTLVVLMCLPAFAACSGSGEVKDVEWGEWVLSEAATCETEGVEIRLDKTNSAVSEVRVVPALGHSYGEWSIATFPTCLV
jgi:hypothetical protein